MKSLQKTTVVFAINDFLVGGVQKLSIDLFNHIDQSCFDIHLVTLFQFPHKKDFFDFVPAHITVHKLNFQNFFDVREWVHLFFVLKTIAPRVVISSLFFTNTVCRILKPLLGYVVIAVEHNTYTQKTGAQIFVDWVLSWITYKIIAVSQTVATFTSTQEKIPLKKFVVIHNGIDMEKIQKHVNDGSSMNSIRKEFFVDGKSKFIINVGRLTAQKNHSLTIEAFNVFSKKHPEYKLIILGEGSLKNALNDQIKTLGLKDKVFLLGARENIVPYYCMSDMFVSTSDIEGFGIAHAEALACGIPVVSTKTAGPDEMIHEGINGYFVDSSVASVVDGIEKVLRTNLVSHKNEIQNSVARFSIKEAARKYEQLISSSYTP